jgi:predicted 3-demethylubiquinone-9 3-methyltransferase (glyoxalase superfamily)
LAEIHAKSIKWCITNPPTMNKVTPFLSFDGQAEEAARFYVSLLPNSRIDRVLRSPVDTHGGPAGSVLLVEFTLAGSPYIALNAPGFTFTEAVSFMIACEDQAEIDRLWAALTADGGEEVACGWLKDRWGVSWQITPTRLMELIKDPDPNRARRAMESMMTMVKIDIAEVERSAEG